MKERRWTLVVLFAKLPKFLKQATVLTQKTFCILTNFSSLSLVFILIWNPIHRNSFVICFSLKIHCGYNRKNTMNLTAKSCFVVEKRITVILDDFKNLYTHKALRAHTVCSCVVALSDDPFLIEPSSEWKITQQQQQQRKSSYLWWLPIENRTDSI